MLRVLMLTTDLQRGGLPLRLVRLACRLRDLDVEPVVGCLAPPGPLNGELNAAGIATFSCDARGAFDVTALGRLATHIRRLQPDLIHSSLFHANLAARLVGRLDRRRPIMTATVTIEIERNWHRWLEALTCGESDLHVANSAAVAEHLRADLGFCRNRVTVIPNGLDVTEIDRAPKVQRHAHGIDDRLWLLVWAGRMDPVKDLPTFVDVVERLNRNLKLKAVLIGDGPQRRRVQELVERKCLGSVITLTLWSDNVPGWLKTADLLLFPSLTEGSPNVVIEAMLCGCPVVASDLPATRELIDPGVHGLLCRPRAVEQFAAAATEILADPKLRHDISTAARDRAARRHDIQDVVLLWRTTYDRLLFTTRNA